MNRLIEVFIPPYSTTPNALDTLALFARFVFLVTLFFFFWNSAMTKFDGFMNISSGAYYQIFPAAYEAAGFDESAFPFWRKAIVFIGSVSEIVLPLLLVLGLFTRLSALGMIGFVIVMTWTDITGHGVDIGTWFNNPDDKIADQRLHWLALFAVPLTIGGGHLSLDKFLGIMRG